MALTHAVEAFVEKSGFDLVEDDDVVFSLSLCREINRIYGVYHADELALSDETYAGLALTLEMLSTLQGTVLDGMPAMRLAVATAQAREMMAVLFGDVGLVLGSQMSQQLREASMATLASYVPNHVAGELGPGAEAPKAGLMDRLAAKLRRRSLPPGSLHLTS